MRHSTRVGQSSDSSGIRAGHAGGDREGNPGCRAGGQDASPCLSHWAIRSPGSLEQFVHVPVVAQRFSRRVDDGPLLTEVPYIVNGPDRLMTG
ncbi:MAG: hypothetical protein R2849_14090 [Thermomicrobiales bacterium]